MPIFYLSFLSFCIFCCLFSFTRSMIFIAACKILVAAGRIQFPTRIKTGPLHWEYSRSRWTTREVPPFLYFFIWTLEYPRQASAMVASLLRACSAHKSPLIGRVCPWECVIPGEMGFHWSTLLNSEDKSTRLKSSWLPITITLNPFYTFFQKYL